MDFIFIEFKPNTFGKIRNALGYTSEALKTSFLDQLQVSYNQVKVIQNSSNNSMVMLTSDKKFVIKTISRKERSVFFRFLLEPYAKRILSCPESRLIRILGVFKLVTSKISFILMENTSGINENGLIFDLKGSSIDRFVNTQNGTKGIILKDENFRKMRVKVQVSLQEKWRIVDTIKEDLKILRDIGIMDYSILLMTSQKFEERNRYCIGKENSLAIIDLFQVYNSRKAVERWFKVWIRRVDKEKISVISPDEYYERLVKFLDEVFCDQDLEREMTVCSLD